MKNTSIKSNFRLDIPDNGLTENFVWQVQMVSFPSVTMETARITRSPKLSNTQLAGTGTEYEDIQITFLLDSELKTYQELYSWMLTMQNPVGPTTVSDRNVPRQGILHILDNTRENTVASFKFYEMYPKMLGEIEWNYTEAGDLESMTCTVTMGYTYFDMLASDGTVIGPRPS